MDIGLIFPTQCAGNGGTLLKDPTHTVGSCGLRKRWATRNRGVKANTGKGNSSEGLNWDQGGPRKAPQLTAYLTVLQTDTGR